jgi:hypothetical protein
MVQQGSHFGVADEGRQCLAARELGVSSFRENIRCIGLLCLYTSLADKDRAHGPALGSLKFRDMTTSGLVWTIPFS